MKKVIMITAVFTLIMTFVSCGKNVKETPEAPQVQSSDGANAAWAKSANSQVERIPVEGFSYKGTEMSATKWDKWAAVAAPILTEIVQKMPAGYVLIIKGHTDAAGPEEPVGNKPGNIKISADRAKTVYEALKRKGLTSDKVVYKGVGSAEQLADIDAKDARQRRVTFEVVKN